MIKIFALFLFLLLAGCGESVEDAPINLKKGNDFYSQGQYEVAEYYYEKIPEESPFYPQAKEKLDSIEIIKREWVTKEISPSDLGKIAIINNKVRIDSRTQIPSHVLTVANNSSQALGSITVKFTYYDVEGNIVGSLTTEVSTPMEPHTRKSFGGIKPGVMDKSFATSGAEILSARHN